MPAVALPGKNLSLPIQLFSAAMEQQASLAAYASHIGLAMERMYEVLTTQPNELQTETLESLAQTYHQPADALRNTPTLASPSETFGAWLKRNMEGVSQHALRKRAHLETRELKDFLNETALPDSDQAERLARALYINRTEVARTIVADMLSRASDDRQASIAAMNRVPAIVPAVKPPRARRRPPAQAPEASLQPEQTSAASDLAPIPAATVLPGDLIPLKRQPTRAKKARHQPAISGASEADDHTVDVLSERAALSESKPVEQGMAVLGEELAAATNSAGEQSETIVVAAEPTSMAPAPTWSAKTHGDVIPMPAADTATQSGDAQPAIQEQTRPKKRPARHAKIDQPNDGAVLDLAPMLDSGIAAATDSLATHMASDSEIQQPDSVSPQPLGNAATATKPGNAENIAPPEQRAIASSARVHRPKKASSQADRSLQKATAPADLTVPEASAPAAVSPQDHTLPAALAGSKAAVPAAGLANQTTSQLSMEEISLLRRWRQLHPQGRRATLLYIASLLLEE